MGGNQDDQSATQYHVEPVENKEFLSYSPVSFQNVRYYQNPEPIHVNSVPIRKVQNIACEVHGKVTALTIDSGCEGNCIRLDTCNHLGIEVLPLDKDDHKVPTQADGESPLEIVGQARFTATRVRLLSFLRVMWQNN